MYLGNESNMIVKLFDPRFAFDGILYIYVYIVLDGRNADQFLTYYVPKFLVLSDPAFQKCNGLLLDPVECVTGLHGEKKVVSKI